MPILLQIPVVLLVLGVLLWLVSLPIPMDPTIRKIINALAIVFVVLWLLRAFGLFAAR